jgi:hypothetical protein
VNILCNCGGLEGLPAWVINYGVGVLNCCLVGESGIVEKNKNKKISHLWWLL